VEAGSHSGFDREEAVQQLGRMGDGLALPVLLERANDWVPQVRVAAHAAIDAFLRDDAATHGPRRLRRSPLCDARGAQTIRGCSPESNRSFVVRRCSLH
jgi:hypothetical protein